MTIFKEICIKFSEFFLKKCSLKDRQDMIFRLTKTSIEKTKPEEALVLLLELDRRIYSLTGNESVRYGNGVHTKHKHIRYHDFFIKNTDSGKKVIDIGCGNGALDYDVVNSKKDVKIIGIDINKENIDFAKKNYKHPNLSFIMGDALIDLPDMKFDIVFLSNVLEHIPNRIEFLRSIQKKVSSSKYILRVPVFERDWRVPLMKELGLDFRLDQTHQIEYTHEEFFEELQNAGLEPENYEVRWGEIWATARPI